MKLLTRSNSKLQKGEAQGYITYILNFAPGDISGHEVCPNRTKDCFENCLFYTGYGNMPSVRNARIARTLFFFEDHDAFMTQLMFEITMAKREAQKENMKIAIRLNGTSDIPWEVMPLPEEFINDDTSNIFEFFHTLPFYDYTKIPIPKRQPLQDNYHLTYSWGGHNKKACLDHLRMGYNIAIPYHGIMPEYWKGYETINGDKNDLRFLDPSPRVVMLKAKGKLRTSDSPFAIGEKTK